MEIILFVVLAGIAVYSVKKYKSNMKYGCCGGGGKESTGRRVEVADREAAHYPYCVEIGIKGMTCQNCVRYVENALNEQEGIWATADLKTNTAQVRMKTLYDKETLARILHRAGYSLTEMKEKTE